MQTASLLSHLFSERPPYRMQTTAEPTNRDDGNAVRPPDSRPQLPPPPPLVQHYTHHGRSGEAEERTDATVERQGSTSGSSSYTNQPVTTSPLRLSVGQRTSTASPPPPSAATAENRSLTPSCVESAETSFVAAGILLLSTPPYSHAQETSSGTCIAAGGEVGGISCSCHSKGAGKGQRTLSGLNANPRLLAHASGNGTTISASSSAHADLCKAARGVAMELMSALMESPPDAERIAHYRRTVHAPPPPPKPPTDGFPSTAETLEETETTTEHHDAQKGRNTATTTFARAPAVGASSSSSSFLEAARNGRPKPSASPALLATTSAATVKSAAAVSGLGQRGAERTAPTTATHPASTSSSRHVLELIPVEAAALPQLLGVLREIALSCATLDSLGKTVESGRGGATTVSGGGVQSGSSEGGVASVIGTLTSTSCEVTQWDRVCQHWEAVRDLVLNQQDLGILLDDTLGHAWRESNCASTITAVQERADPSTEMPSAAKAAEEDAFVTLDDAHPGAVPVMPVPVDHSAPESVRGQEGTAPSHGSTATALASSPSSHTPTMTTSTTTLNHKARPFHSRTTPFSAMQAGPTCYSTENVTLSAGDTSVWTPTLNTQATLGTANTTTSANGAAAATSMKQLSECSSTYSPSPHVTTFLERTTPPPSGRTAEEGESGLNLFPSTPLSEAAAPYQPSVAVTGGTSPRGGYASVSSLNTPFHLESREDMLRRRSAAPNAFYASMSHGGATHFLASSPSAATTPGTFVPSTAPGGAPPFALTGTSAVRSLPVSPLLGYGSPVSPSQCPYDYILVLDFEATCEEHPPPHYLYEIIEFPVVVVDVRLQRVVAEFHRFVRPRYKTELSTFCRELTGMRQSDVDLAPSLEEVILQFERWYSHTVPPQARCVFATDGPMDMREFMYHHSVSRQGIRFPPLFYQYIDVKQTFASFFLCSKGKIKAMLEVLHLPFEGRLHSGLDDARNIASIVMRLLEMGCTFCDVPLNRLPLNGVLLSSGAGGGSNASTPLSLPPSTAAAGSARHRGSAVVGGPVGSPRYVSAPYSVDEDDY